MAEKKVAKPQDKSPGKPMPKSQIYESLAGKAGLTRKQVAQVFDSLGELIKQELGKKGPGVFAVPGLLKLKRVTKPATKAGKRPNPFKPGEMMEVKAKPAQNKVKAMPLKALKDLVK